MPVRRIKAKKGVPASAVFPAPANTASGTYRVVVCADTTGAVRERKETNNCKGSTSTVQIVGSTTTTGPVTVSATAGTGGTVAASGVGGGTCAATTCTFPTVGTGTVTFTPTASSGYRFGAWGGATCTGFTNGADDAITFTNPTGNKACTATFIKQVTISYSVSPIQVVVVGSVSGAASHGSCTNDPVTGGWLVPGRRGCRHGHPHRHARRPAHLPGMDRHGVRQPHQPAGAHEPHHGHACTATFGVV